MQVKKFEATSMNEALEMIKSQMGPDAIILSVKDHSASFGLMGKKSIEVTAAISETQLKKKQWAESRLNDQELGRLKRNTAKSQKQFIEKSVNRYLKPQIVAKQSTTISAEGRVKRDLTQTRYIEIDNDNIAHEESHFSELGTRVDDLLKKMGTRDLVIDDTPSTRVKSAVKSAYEAFEGVVAEAPVKNNHVNNFEVDSLKSEVQNLRKLVYELKNNSNPWNKSVNLPAEFKESYDKLTRSGLSESLVYTLLEQASSDLRPDQYKSSFIEATVVKKMLNEIKTSEFNLKSPLQLFFGPRGHGKTSHLVKLASHYVIKENKKVAIFTADTNKVGAVDQLKIYAQILNVPFGVIHSPQDWEMIRSNIQNFDYVFVDFPGSSIKNVEEMSEIRRLLPPVTMPQDVHLVMSVACKDDDAFEFAERYKFCNYKDVIFTFLDESVNHGLIYNFNKTFDVPLHSFGVGSKIPEDFEIATRERVIDLIFKISKIKPQGKDI